MVGFSPTTTLAQNVYGVLPEFSLKDHENSPFEKKNLHGKIWLMHTFFTSCASVCPTLITDIKKIILALPEVDRPAVMSITVDPLKDTPEHLAEYHHKHGLCDFDWKLITGEPNSITTFIEKGLLLASPGGDTPDAHSPRIVLIDKESKIRGFYHISDPLDIQRLQKDLKALISDKTLTK